MQCLLEIHSKRKIFQYLMKSSLSLIRIMSNTWGSTNQMLVVPQIQTIHYREHSFKLKSVNTWNLYQRNLKTDLITCDFAKFKKLIFPSVFHHPIFCISCCRSRWFTYTNPMKFSALTPPPTHPPPLVLGNSLSN